MAATDGGTRSCVTTVRLSEAENRELEELARFFGATKSDVLADGMHMVRDLKQVIEDLIRENPNLANVLKDSLIPGILSVNFRRERMGEVAEKLLVGLVKKDLLGAGRRAKLVLKLFER